MNIYITGVPEEQERERERTRKLIESNKNKNSRKLLNSGDINGHPDQRTQMIPK